MPTPRKLTLDDLWAFKMLGAISLSPDGKLAAFVMHSTDKAKNEQRSAIWLLHLDEQARSVSRVLGADGGVVPQVCGNSCERIPEVNFQCFTTISR